MRRRHSLGGTDSLAEDPVAELRLHGVPHDEIHAAAEDLFQPAMNPEEVEEPDRPVELDKQVNIAVRRGLAAGHGPEDGEGANPEPRKLGSLLGESALNVFAGHAQIIERPGRLGQPGVRRGHVAPLSLDLGHALAAARARLPPEGPSPAFAPRDFFQRRRW